MPGCRRRARRARRGRRRIARAPLRRTSYGASPGGPLRAPPSRPGGGASVAPRAARGVTVGIDMVSIDAIEDSIRVHAERYLGRVYTTTELDDCRFADGTYDVPRRAPGV